jgi:hypothetical protein
MLKEQYWFYAYSLSIGNRITFTSPIKESVKINTNRFTSSEEHF